MNNSIYKNKTTQRYACNHPFNFSINLEILLFSCSIQSCDEIGGNGTPSSL
jgi:hypothetical protein